MDSLAINKLDRLFWLGRYTSRVMIEIDILEKVYDQIIDGPDYDYVDFCQKLEIPNVYTSSEDFTRRFILDKEDPYSIISNMNCAYDNAIMLRDTISSGALSYIEMATNTMEAMAEGRITLLGLDDVVDDLYAFSGRIDETLLESSSRYTLKCGSIVETIDMSIRLNYRLDELSDKLTMLNYRMQHMPLRRDGKRLTILLDLAPNPDPVHNRFILLDCIEGLFPDV